MTVVVRDLVPAFLDFWNSPQRNWAEYTGQHPEVLNDFVRMGRPVEPERLEKALATYPDLEERILANAPHATRWIERAAAIVAPALDAQHLDIHGVAMVGLGTSNGWVDDGTLYLAVEMVPDESSAEILAAHEIAHALQLPLPEIPWLGAGPLGRRIYSEGFATALTAELIPQYPLVEHLWFGPGYDDWLVDCESRRQEAEAAILADLDSEDNAVTGRYLTMSGVTDLPKRIGYFVGTRLIQSLRRDHGWPELARWSTDRAMDELRARLTA